LLSVNGWRYLQTAYRIAYREAKFMPKGHISKRSVDALTCQNGKDRTLLWDDSIVGFGVAAFPSGRKIYLIQYRQGKRSRRVHIGEHGRLTPEEARIQAKKLLGAVAAGADPISERCKERSVPLFREMAEIYMAAHIKAKRKARTFASYATLLRLHILPVIGSVPITELRRGHISQMHASALHPGAANRALTVVSAIFNWTAAERDDLELPPNPAKGIKRNPEQGCERFLTTEELARLGDALREGETIGLPYNVDEAKPKANHAPKLDKRRVKLDPFAVAAIRLLILTGARLREILDAQWQHVDCERGILFLQDSKTGRKPVYLSAPAMQVLASLPRIAGNPHIIAGEREGASRADLKKPWAAVCKFAGLDGVRLHDLRHSFASIGAGASMGLPVIGKLLGHSQAATTHRYAHLDADPLRRAVETIGATISAAMDGGKGGEVVSLHRTKPAS
jgi:integrase